MVISLAHHFTPSPTFKGGILHLTGDEKFILLTILSFSIFRCV